MKRWEYDISSYSVDQVLALRDKLGYPAGAERPVMFCTDKGACVLDNVPSANTKALLHNLNARGAEGWQLSTVTFRSDEMICFWMRKAEDTEKPS
jgi:hypothetical protein